MIWPQTLPFRLPMEVIDEEVNYILDLGVSFKQRKITSMKEVMAEGYDAIFVGSGAPRGRDLEIPGRKEGAKNIHIGIDWLSSVSFGHTTKIGKRVIVLGGGNTAMDCCRTSRRLGGDDVKVIVRSGFDEMKASPWEKEDAMHEGIPILNYLVPKTFQLSNGRLSGMTFQKVKAVYDDKGRRDLVPTGEPDQFFECDDVLVAVGQENAFPWIERDAGISIEKLLAGEDVRQRPAPGVTVMSQKMGIHEWSYDNQIHDDARYKVPWRDIKETLKNVKAEVELGFDVATAWKEAQRCLNCDVQTVFSDRLCIECDACVDICPMDCITFTTNGEEKDLRSRLNAPAKNLTQDLYVSGPLKTQRVMVKDEDVCLHCGLCAERCPTGAWDMQKYLIEMAQPGANTRPYHKKAA